MLDEDDSDDELSAVMTLAAGTPVWMAPETVDGRFGKARYGLPADVYSFGITMWETLTRKTPYEDIKCPTRVLLDRIMKEGLRPTMPAGDEQAEWFEQLMRQCWDGEPSKRPTFRAVVEAFGQSSQPTVPLPARHVKGSSTDETSI